MTDDHIMDMLLYGQTFTARTTGERVPPVAAAIIRDLEARVAELKAAGDALADAADALDIRPADAAPVDAAIAAWRDVR